ncbi:hypothetical protein BDV96DRAFT_587585 [Lophiotrema nucula]|uniref:Uncharacterized protein n=1 Tax=Lophiotrema nucula TaxID=690887 RepID=A0A6A5YQ51_9PLEO|nr:hypothetical protein BDV96DRAFT_587585 [Lophiotrema nucula]
MQDEERVPTGHPSCVYSRGWEYCATAPKSRTRALGCTGHGSGRLASTVAYAAVSRDAMFSSSDGLRVRKV